MLVDFLSDIKRFVASAVKIKQTFGAGVFRRLFKTPSHCLFIFEKINLHMLQMADAVDTRAIVQKLPHLDLVLHYLEEQLAVYYDKKYPPTDLDVILSRFAGVAFPLPIETLAILKSKNCCAIP